jgi:glycosyltransferase involved in cell wall biosynthesis
VPSVLHISDYGAPYPGSFVRQLELLDTELSNRGWGPSAFGFPPRAQDASWHARLRSSGNPVYTVPHTSRTHPFRGSSTIAAIIDAVGSSIVHTHFGSYDLAAVRGMRGARPADRSLIWHYRTELPGGVGGRRWTQRLKDAIKYRYAGRSVKRCIAVTEAMAREVAARGMGDRAVANIAGCDTGVFRPDPASRSRIRGRLRIGDDSVLILHFGWHWQRKGGDLLSAATRTLAARGVGEVAVISVGAPPEQVEPPVRPFPFIDRIEELHQAADVFVSASRSEAFGNGLIEALACANVAVAARVEGQRETFEHLDGCVAVPVNDAGAIAEALASLIQRRPDWPALGAANRSHIERNYSMHSWVNRMADIYDELRAEEPALVS